MLLQRENYHVQSENFHLQWIIYSDFCWYNKIKMYIQWSFESHPTLPIDLHLPTKVWVDTDVHWACAGHPFIRVGTDIPGTFHCHHGWPIRKSFTRTTVDHSFRIYSSYSINGLVHGFSQGWRRTTVYASMVISILVNIAHSLPNFILWTSVDKSASTSAPLFPIVTNIMSICTKCGASRWDG